MAALEGGKVGEHSTESFDLGRELLQDTGESISLDPREEESAESMPNSPLSLEASNPR